MTVLSNFIKKLRIVFNNCGIDPIPGSPAIEDLRSFRRPESIQLIFSQASVVFIATTDNLEALDTLVDLQSYSVAPWVCARGFLESATLSKWLLDKNINALERVGRSLSLKYTVLREQEKMANSENDPEKVNSINLRIEAFEKIALELGFKPLRDKNNKRIGIAKIKPSITELIKNQFEGEIFYRILSGIAHSNYTSLIEISLMPVQKNQSGMVGKEAVPIEIQKNLVLHSIVIYCQCVWQHSIYFGFNCAEVALWLEELYNEFEFPDTNKSRFWRTLIGTSS